MKTKLLSLLLAISLIFGLLPIMIASAETLATDAPTSAPTSAPVTQSSTTATSAPTTVPTTKPATTSATTKPASLPSTATTAATTKATNPTPAVTTSATTAPATTTPTVTSAPTTEPTGATDPTSSGISVSVKLCETSETKNYLAVLTVSKGGAPVYATTNDSGVPSLVANGSVPTNKYIKFEYPENGLPTITLMNVKLRSSGNVLDLSSFDIAVKIIVAGNSSIESTGKCGIYRASYGDITILGPKKLTMNCSSSAIAFSADPYANSLSLKGLTLSATTFSDTAGRTFHIPAGNLTIDNCNIELINRVGNAVYLGQGTTPDAKGRGNATISNSVFSANSKNTALQIDGNMLIVGSNTQFSSDTRALFCVGDLTLKASTTVMTGRSNTVETVNVGGEFTLRTSNAEIIGTKFVIFSDTTLPRTIGEYTVVAGISRESSAPFNEALTNAYQYYYAESLEQPIDPTIPTGVDSTDPTATDSTDATATDSTDATATDSTDVTYFPPAEPTGDPTASQENSLPTLPIPTISTNTTASRSGALFWILAALMVLGACGAVTMAVIMFRRSAEEEQEDEWDEESQEDTEEKSEEDVDEAPKKFSLMYFKNLFTRSPKEDILEEVSEETTKAPCNDNAIESETVIEESLDDSTEDSQNGTEEKPKKFFTNKLKAFFEKILEETAEDDTEEDSET